MANQENLENGKATRFRNREEAEKAGRKCGFEKFAEWGLV